MKHITQATEKRINSMLDTDAKYYDGYILNDLMHKAMSWSGCTRWTIAESAKLGDHAENNVQLHVSRSDEATYREWASKYPEYISFTACLDICHVDIYDFNRLVSSIAAE